MKKQTIKCIAASLAIMGCISSIPQRVLASIDDIAVVKKIKKKKRKTDVKKKK